jgi:uncharacterized repeat protein (TIGR01451 family)
VITSGTYLPTAYGVTDPLPTNASNPKPPVPPYPTNLNTFVGQQVNGPWYLWVADVNSLDSGSISNGWSLSISTGIPLEQDSDLEVSLTPSLATATVSNAFTYVIAVTNYGPAVATNVVISDLLPAGVTFVTNSCNCVETNAGLLTYSAGTLGVSNGVSFNVTVIPTTAGYITNIVTAIANEPDPNSNNIQTNITLVTTPTADVGVSVSATPNPVLDGGTETFTIVVTNGGPSAATGVVAVNVLPTGFLPVTTTPSQGSVTNAGGTTTWNVGSLSNVNSTATLTITAGVGLPAGGLPSTNLDSVTVSSAVYDPVKLNNFASAKIEVDPETLKVTPLSGGNYQLSFPASSNVQLQGSVKLPPTWITIPNSSLMQQIMNGQTNNTYIVPGTNGYHFFRLVAQVP